ncbi:MAG: hypothetical protein JW850_08965 [Thermoflexales bacterium]|nr:hypothetical protein [Thermoflexales bacterium]
MRSVRAIRDLVCLATMVLLASSGVQIGHAQANNRVALVVQFGDGSTVTRCIEFSEAEIGGHDALARSGLAIVADYTNLGTAICKIEGTGCPASDCLTCAAPSYWSYWHLQGGGWVYAQQGSSSYRLHDGDVEGWSWGTGAPPPILAFEQVCVPPLPPTDVPAQPTATPEPALAQPTAGSEPAPAQPQPTPVVWFRLDQNPIPAGTCTAVRWDTSGASELYLDGQRVDVIGGFEACPSAPQEYHLRVVNAAGEQVHTLTLGVTGDLPTSTPLPLPSPTLAPATATRPPSTPTLPPATATRPPSTPTFPPATATRPPSPTLAPATATRPPSTSTVRPSPTATPSYTPIAAAIVIASPTPNAIPSSPAASSSEARSHSAASQPSTTWGYLTFGLIALGLTVWLAWGALRRK